MHSDNTNKIPTHGVPSAALPVILISAGILACVVVFYLLLPLSLDSPRDITDFNSDVKAMLWDKYRLSISDGIIFVGGHYDNAFQDSSVHLTLRVPDGKLSSFYDAARYKDVTMPGDRDAHGNNIQKRLEYGGELYTHIDFYSSEDGYTIVKFTGRYPGSRPGV